MNETFKIPFFKPWTVTDTKLIVGDEEVPFTSITKIDHKPNGSTAQIWVGKKFYTMSFKGSDIQRANEAMNYIREHQFTKKEKELLDKEFRMRCNVCGHVFCYKFDDIAKNITHAKHAKSSAILGVVNAIGGTQLGTYANINETHRHLDKIIDFNKCPKCNSTDLSDVSDGDLSPNNTAQANTNISVADEIKKFKDLLDSGIITQEEFDAKKKQLLGL